MIQALQVTPEILTSNTDNIITRSSESIVSVYEELTSKLIEALGGYLIFDSVVIEYEDGSKEEMRRINWLHEDDLYYLDQVIDFNENLLNIKINVKNTSISFRDSIAFSIYLHQAMQLIALEQDGQDEEKRRIVISTELLADSKRYEHLISKLSPTKFQGVLDEFI